MSVSTTRLGEWMKQRRKVLDITQEELADRVGCSYDTIRKIESGTRRPSRQVAALIAEALEVPPEERASFTQWARRMVSEDGADAGLIDTDNGTLPPVDPSNGGDAHSNHSLRAHADGLSEEVAPLPVANPYKGLRAFEEEDASDFFGRESLVARLHARLEEPSRFSHFLAVVGPSGSGKSSLVQAGLIPALRGSGLPGGLLPLIASMLPGTRPQQELDAALVRAFSATGHTYVEDGDHASGRGEIPVDGGSALGARLRTAKWGLGEAISQAMFVNGNSDAGVLLFIDQFEEIFTLTHDEQIRSAWLNDIYRAVCDPSRRVWVVVTMRADFYDRPLLYPGMSELFGERTEVVGPMSYEDLHMAIVGPARRAGLELEEGLVAAIERDVAEQPGALPLLQYSLTELYERRSGRTLTLQAYRESGGVLQALGARAEAIYSGLVPAEQEEARQMFLRLVVLGEGGGESRRRVLRAELASAARDEEALDSVLELFGRYRLLTFDRDPVTRGPTVEVAHEALLSTWGRLRRWLDESRGRLRVQRLLMAASEEWANNGKDPGLLASGTRLAQFEALVDAYGESAAGISPSTSIALTASEREYVAASVDARERERTVREHLRRRIVTGLLAGLVLTLALAALAVVQSVQANNERDIALSQASARSTAEAVAEASNKEAQDQQKIAFSRELAAKSISEIPFNPNLGLLLAIESGKVAETDAAQDALQHALIETQPHAELRYRPGVFVTSAAFSLDGTWIATTSGTSTTRVWEVNASTGTSGNVIAEMFLPRDYSTSEGHVSFSPNKKQLLIVSTDRTARVWDIESKSVVREFRQTDSANDASFSPDGTRIVIAGGDGIARVWEVSGGTNPIELKGHTDIISSVAFSPDGRTIITASRDNSARLFDAATGRLLRTFAGHAAGVTSAAFGPDGRWVVTGSADSTARVWNVDTGASLMEYRGHTDRLNSAAFSPDGRLLVTASADNTARVWDVTTGESLARIAGSDMSPASTVGGTGTVGILRAAFSPDGTKVLFVTGGGDGAAYVYPWRLFAPFQQLMSLAPELAPRQFTCAEKQTYLHQDIQCGTPTVLGR